MTHNNLFPEPTRKAPRPPRNTTIAATFTAIAIGAAVVALRIHAQNSEFSAWAIPTPVLIALAALTTATALLWVRPRTGNVDAIFVSVLLGTAALFMEVTLGALPLTLALSIILGTQPWRRK